MSESSERTFAGSFILNAGLFYRELPDDSIFSINYLMDASRGCFFSCQTRKKVSSIQNEFVSILFQQHWVARVTPRSYLDSTSMCAKSGLDKENQARKKVTATQQPSSSHLFNYVPILGLISH